TISGIPATTGYFDIVLGAENSFGAGTGRLSLVVSAPAPPHSLQNIATRVFVGTDADIAIAGFILTGPNPKPIIVRGLGPSLSAAGVSGVLPAPQLEIRAATGAIGGSNSTWLSEWETTHQTGLPPSDRKDTALARTVSPGSLTALLKGIGPSG